MWPSPSTLYAGPILAPMVRSSFPGMRTLAAALGASAVYTGAIVGDSLKDTITEVDSDTMTIRISTVHRCVESPSRVILSTPIRATETPGQFEPMIPLIVQLAVNEHDDLDKICSIVAPWCVGIDINLGCGASFAISGGRGQRLMSKADDVIARFMKAIRHIEENLGRPISFSVKQRLLGSVDETIDRMRAFYELGVNCIVIHMRKKGEERGSTRADWDSFFRVLSGFYIWLWSVSCHNDSQSFKNALKIFQIVANGDLFTREAINDFFSLSEQHLAKLPIEMQPHLTNRYGHLTPVMLARGAISDLSLFSFIIGKRGESIGKVSTPASEGISEALSFLKPIDGPLCYLNHAKALLKASETTNSNFNNYKYTILNGIAFARSHEIYKSSIQRLAYKHFNRALQTPKSYNEYRNLLNTLSSQPYSYWAKLVEE